MIPTNPAIVVIDMHRGSCEPPGTVYVQRSSLVLKPLQKLLRAARIQQVPVVFVNYQARLGGPDVRNPFWMSGGLGKLYPTVHLQIEGSRWTEVMPDLEPSQGDYHVNTKRRYSAFFGTDLDLLLKNLKVETVVLTGVMTEICILCSAFEAFNRDYRVVVVKDCTAGRDPETEACVLQRIIALEVGWVLTSEEVIQSFGKPLMNS